MSRALRGYGRLWLPAVVFLLLFLPEARAHQVAILEVDINSYQVHRAVEKLDLPAGIVTRFYTWQDLKDNPDAKRFIAGSAVVLVNVMMPELADYMVDEKLMAGRQIYALNSAGDPEALAKQGYRFDPEILAYYHNLSVANLVNLVRLTVHRHIDPAVAYGALAPVPEACIHHPDAPGPFLDAQSYQRWYAARGGYKGDNPRVGLLYYTNTLKEGQVEAADDLIRRLETAGFNVTAAFGPVPQVFDLLKPAEGRPPVSMVLAFSLKFSSGLNDEVRAALKALDVPIFNAISPYGDTIDAWRRSEVGLGPMETVWAVATPEFSGSIEPTVLSGKKEIVDAATGRRLFVYESVPECVELLVARMQKLAALQRVPNARKRVAVIYYNHSQGKQSIGAAYLNVFRSLQEILGRMSREGYAVEGVEGLTEERIQALIMASGRNIGSWAPGELDALVAAEAVVQLPLDEYRRWFARLPAPFKEAVIAQWGPPESNKIMVRQGRMILPMVRLGNVVLLPEPARGWTDEPEKLYHDTTLFPHHQYIAAYLWLSEKFEADAMVHLGTHATYEWLPGKQVGLAAWDPPEIMTGAIPNIYPYIVDDVGEGVQVKRRGRGVIVDHLTPPMKEADLYNEYAELKALLGKYERALSMGAETAEAYLRQLADMVAKLGLLKDLEMARFDAAAVETLDLYLHEMDTNSLPYGLHTFGKPYDPQAAKETVALIRKQNPQADGEQVRRDLTGSAGREMENLLRGLAGRYVPAGEGNDPLRNLAAIPTGKNFYGFSPAKVPSKAAWEIGQRAAVEMIENKRRKDGKYPDKVGVVLWATETTRNEGVHESTILHLMGVEPVWDATERVTGTRVVPGPQLGRPRIDVLINPSGLYRDMFPNLLLLLDAAVQQALAQTDVENFLALNKARIKTALLAEGLGEAEAETQSRFRIFTEKVGSYGNGVEEMIGASGLWESDTAITDVYLNRTQFAVGQGQWAVPVKTAFKENLRHVDVAVHSRSSNVIGIIDTDDFFMYLGGMSLAVKHVSGMAPDTLVTMHRRKDELKVEDVARTIGMELRTRYLNPQWIEGMKRDNYAGAKQMADFAENFWGWQVTVPSAVDHAQWQQVFEVYVEDKYGLELKPFFDQRNPWAYQSMTARMLEAARKKYWAADEKTTQKLADEYALGVVAQGVTCCDHTCNNPMLHQLVLNTISRPGGIGPELVEKFRRAVETASAAPLERQVRERQALLARLATGTPAAMGASADAAVAPGAPETRPDAAPKPAADGQTVRGFKMEDAQAEQENPASGPSGLRWVAPLGVLLALAVFFWGARQRAAAPESLLGAAMVIVALFVFLSVAVMPQFAEAERVFRLALRAGGMGSPQTGHPAWIGLAAAAAFAGGFGARIKWRRRI